MTNHGHPLVTIAIPTYNRADSYLRNALECALNQTYTNIEVVVADNCSTDGTKHLVENYADPRLAYIRHDKTIPANDNFNFCLRQAKGEFFLLLHDDDLIDKDFIDTCIRHAASALDIGIIRTGTRIIDSEGNVLTEKLNMDEGLSTQEFLMSWLESRSVLFLCSTLFNTKYLLKIGGFNSKHQLFQDVLAELELATMFGRVDVREAKASFREHVQQRTMLSRMRDWCDESLFLLEKICALAPGNETVVRKEGMRRFTKHNYDIAQKVRSPVKRYAAYFIVYRAFGYQYFPPLLGRLLSKLRRIAGPVARGAS